MKRIYYIIICLCGLFIAESLSAQENNTPQQRRSPEVSRGSTQAENSSSSLSDLTIRAQEMNDRMIQDIGNARWMRVIYRELDLEKEANAPLYYPTRPLNGMMNLFTIIFQLMSEGKLTAYEYVPDYEIFDEAHIVQFKDVLDRAYIYYEEIPGRAGAATSYVVNESDIPAGDVLAYYVKEAWYFDQNNSAFDVKTLAICPILTTMGDFGEQRMPLFWLPYENIRPYINNMMIMTSSVNNAKTLTVDDYFRRRMFDGEIIKTENLMNKTLREYYPEPDSLQLAQKQIEQQLVDFRSSLWIQPDTTIVATNEKKSSTAKTTTSTRAPKATTTAQPKATPAPKTQSAPVRSVRRTR
jgi:gliding motility associated protien GldN